MDTNLVQVLVQALSERQEPRDPTNMLLVVGLLTPLCVAFVAWINARTSAELKKQNTELKTASAENAVTLEKIHTDGNSRLTLLMSKVDVLTAEVLRLTSANATLVEQKAAQRGTGPMGPAGATGATGAQGVKGEWGDQTVPVEIVGPNPVRVAQSAVTPEELIAGIDTIPEAQLNALIKALQEKAIRRAKQKGKPQ